MDTFFLPHGPAANVGKQMVRWCVVLCLGWALSVNATQGDDGRLGRLITVAGEQGDAELVAWDAERVEFRSEEQATTVPIEELVKWGSFRDYERGELVLLRDGSRLVCRDPLGAGAGVRYRDGRFTLRCAPWQPVDVDVSQLRAVCLRPLPTLEEQDRFDAELLGSLAEQDTVWLVSRDILRGTLQEISEERLRIVVEGQEVVLSLAQAFAVSFRQPRDAKAVGDASHRATWGLRNGGTIHVARWARVGQHWTVTTTGGVQLVAMSRDTLLRELTAWQVFGGNVDYLSDREPAAFRHVPLWDATLPLARNRSVVGTRLRKQRRGYEKGLGVSTTSRAAYVLDADAKAFAAEVAVDDEAEQGGSVVFRVYLSEDGKQWKMAYESRQVTGRDPAVSVRVPLGGARFISLIADYADRGDVLDYADWLDARVLK